MKSDCCLAKLLMRPQNLIQSRPRATRSTSSSSPATMRRSRSLYTCTCRSTTLTTQERMCDGVSRTGRCKVGGRVQFAFMAGLRSYLDRVGRLPPGERVGQRDASQCRRSPRWWKRQRSYVHASTRSLSAEILEPLSPARSNEVGLRVARPGRHSYTDWLKCSPIGSVSYPIKIDILDCSRQLDGSSQVPNGSVRGQQHGASLSRPLCMLDRPGNVGQVIGRRYME